MTPEQERSYLASHPAAKQATGPIEIHGNPGWQFSIRGSGFGSAGSLTIGGMAIPCTRWDDENIRGDMPVDVTTPGDIKITPFKGGMVQTGVYDPAARRAAADQHIANQAHP
jgi:hypothetical protein